MTGFLKWVRQKDIWQTYEEEEEAVWVRGSDPLFTSWATREASTHSEINVATNQGIPGATRTDSPLEFQGEHSPANNLIHTCALQNCERINLCCLCQFATAATGNEFRGRLRPGDYATGRGLGRPSALLWVIRAEDGVLHLDWRQKGRSSGSR